MQRKQFRFSKYDLAELSRVKSLLKKKSDTEVIRYLLKTFSKGEVVHTEGGAVAEVGNEVGNEVGDIVGNEVGNEVGYKVINGEEYFNGNKIVRSLEEPEAPEINLEERYKGYTFFQQVFVQSPPHYEVVVRSPLGAKLTENVSFDVEESEEMAAFIKFLEGQEVSRGK